MSSSTAVDVKLISGREETLFKAVNLKSFILPPNKQCSTIKIENMNNATDFPVDSVWTFCLNNKSAFEDLCYLEFDRRIHEHPAIKYFYKMLEQNNISYGMSNHTSAHFTLTESALTTRVDGSDHVGLYKWMMANAK